MSSVVRCVACTAVNRGPSAPASRSTATGERPKAASTCRFSAGCSETWACSGSSPVAATIRATSSGSTARSEWIAVPSRALPRSTSDPCRASHTGMLLMNGRCASLGGTAVPFSSRPPCRYSVSSRVSRMPASRAAVITASAITVVGIAVQVVELAHRRVPGQQQFGIERGGERVVALGIEPGRGRVHLLAPGPEVAALGMGTAAQCTVEGVGVAVGDAGEGESRQHGVAGLSRAVGDRGDRPGLLLEAHPAPGSTRRPGRAPARRWSRRHPPHDGRERGDPRSSVRLLGVLLGRMRDAGRVAHEDHRSRHPGK